MQASVAPVCFHVFVGGFVFGDDFLKIEDVCSIYDICSFFSTYTIFGSIFLHTKARKSRQNILNKTVYIAKKNYFTTF